MTPKEQLEIIKRVSEQIEALESEREAINEDIKGSELGRRRKDCNVRLKRVRIALNDVIDGRGNYDPSQMTIEEYFEERDFEEDDYSDE